jgi:hypothetical protein
VPIIPVKLMPATAAQTCVIQEACTRREAMDIEGFTVRLPVRRQRFSA